MASENAPTRQPVSRQALTEIAEIVRGLAVLAEWQHELIRRATALLPEAKPDRPARRHRPKKRPSP